MTVKIPTREVTADEALALAKFQLPGVKIVVGPIMARVQQIEPRL